MHSRKRRLRSLAIALVVLVTAYCVSRFWVDVYTINTSDSLPHGLYVRTNQPIEIGCLVEFAPPPMAIDYAVKRWGEEPDRVRFLKPVVAGPGDVVSLSSDWLLVNGHPLAPILTHDSDGNALPCYWKSNPSRVLREHEILVVSTYSESFDSRFFGPLVTTGDSNLVVRRPLWLW